MTASDENSEQTQLSTAVDDNTAARCEPKSTPGGNQNKSCASILSRQMEDFSLINLKPSWGH